MKMKLTQSLRLQEKIPDLSSENSSDSGLVLENSNDLETPSKFIKYPKKTSSKLLIR